MCFQEGQGGFESGDSIIGHVWSSTVEKQRRCRVARYSESDGLRDGNEEGDLTITHCD